MTDAQKKEKGVWVTQSQVKLTGSPDIALFLAQCEFWSKCDIVKRRSGWFYKTRNEWKEETWLSRYKQEKARNKLKDLCILQERHERRNDGIRLWFRINTGLLNALLNNLENKTPMEHNTIDMNVWSEKQAYKEVNTDIDNIESVSTLTESSDTDDFTESEISSHAREEKSGTNVPESVKEPEETPYSLDPHDYTFCHVFIYQFVKTRVLHLNATQRMVWQVYGLDDHDLFNLFCLFVEKQGPLISQWYRKEVAIEIQNLTADDLVYAQIAGRRIYESA